MNDQNRKANQIKQWLERNPAIGALNDGTYYKFVDGSKIDVKPLFDSNGFIFLTAIA